VEIVKVKHLPVAPKSSLGTTGDRKSNIFNQFKKGKGEEQILIGPRARGKYWRAGSRNQQTASVNFLAAFQRKDHW
jgi:hypothetical protein